MIDLNKLSSAARNAAMGGGTAEWGQWGSSAEHVRYMEEITGDRRRCRKCRCGCEQKETHKGFANGVCLVGGCELKVARWVRVGK